jgi:hypothetical protein
MMSKITHGPGNLRAPGRVSLTMAIVIASRNSPAAALAADPDVLGNVASRIDEVADRLSATDPPQPAVLPAVVPQAARLEEALLQARRRQAEVLSGFAAFYRASATVIGDTAVRVDRAEGDASTTFRTGFRSGFSTPPTGGAA